MKVQISVDINNYFNIIDKTKSFEDQIKTLKKKEDDLSQYWNLNYDDDNKKKNIKSLI